LLSRTVAAKEELSGEKKNLTTGLLIAASLFIGFWMMLTRGIPDIGIAWYSLVAVIGITGSIAVSYFSAFRLSLYSFGIRSYQRLILPFVRALEGGEVYGNSSK